MEEELSVGARFLNGFLRVMVLLLVLVLAAVVVCMLLTALGIL